MKNFVLTAIFVVAFLTQESTAQCLLVPIDLSTRVSSSDLIVEASLVKQESFRHNTDQHIYTANYLKIYKIFKGELQDDQVVLISPGGFIDGSGEDVQPSIQLSENMTGIFFLYTSNITADESLANYRPLSGPQACIYYDMSTATGSDVFTRYGSIENDIYSAIESYAGYKAVEMEKLTLTPLSQDKSSTVITDISPMNVAAGINDEIIIKGKDFGSQRGSGVVSFSNASTGLQWVEPVSPQYRLWTDTMIVVRVPHNAGTGAIKVTTLQGTGITTGPNIRFAHLNFYNFSKALAPLHKDNDGKGGFVWTMSTAFNNNTAAKNAVLRALASWSDVTCINWSNGPPSSTNQDKEDKVNNIRFSASGELEMGVLGITRNYWKICQSNTGYTNEIDLSYDPDINWNFGPQAPSFNQHDFESVVVHELGHAHQLGHVNNNGDFMYATLGKGQSKRDLIDTDIEAGLYIMKNSVVAGPCGPPPMVGRSGCSLPLGLMENPEIREISVYPNPFTGRLHIENNTDRNVELDVYNSLGMRIDLIRIEALNQNHTWEIPPSMTQGLYIIKNRRDGHLVSKVIYRP
jgi:hypothetical protein